MGWLWLALLGTAAMAAMVLLGLPRRLWSFAGAALMLGAAGYAVQGRPFAAARPAAPAVGRGEEDPAITNLRDDLFGRLSQDHAYQVAADAMTRTGEKRAAVQALLGGVNRLPLSYSLWTGLGGALAAHDGRVSPAARLAFDQALRLAPRHPGPPFFLGLALVRANEYAAARRWWARSLALCPRDTAYRRQIALRLALLDRLLAERGQASGTPAP